jgi:hypothetical protein
MHESAVASSVFTLAHTPIFSCDDDIPKHHHNVRVLNESFQTLTNEEPVLTSF